MAEGGFKMIDTGSKMVSNCLRDVSSKKSVKIDIIELPKMIQDGSKMARKFYSFCR